MKLAPKSVATFTVLLLGLGVVALWRNSPVALPVAPAEPQFADTLPAAPTTALTPTPAQAAEPNPSSVASRPPGQVLPPRAFIFGESGPVTLDEIPSGRFRDQLLVVSDVARARALTALGALRVPISNLASLHVDAEGNLFFACPHSPLARYDEAAFLPASGPTANSAASNEFTVSVPNSTPPVRHSRPGASRVIYLDFNGHVVTGTSWNSTAGAPSAFLCTPYDTDGNAGSFSPAEQAAIVLIWERVAESFRPFDVDVTTEQPATFNNSTARALITNPRILILDEATSALDYESERLVQENMRGICQGRTVIIIAHRLAAVRQADRIITVERGRIVEDGTHDDLLRRGGRYAALWRHQLGLVQG